MYTQETSGLASYQQTMNQTPGLASSIWQQGTSIQPQPVFEIEIPGLEEKERKPLEEKTA